MAVKMILDYQNVKSILSRTIDNDARPIIILEADAEDRRDLSSELFCSKENVFEIPFSEFLTEYIYNISKQASLLSYSYIVINDIENLRGFSKTLKILSTFIDNMASHNVAVVFMGSNISYDMSEVIHISGSKIQYIIKMESERT